jgi:hypothetical protein
VIDSSHLFITFGVIRSGRGAVHEKSLHFIASADFTGTFVQVSK